jgi:hypothetical protein
MIGATVDQFAAQGAAMETGREVHSQAYVLGTVVVQQVGDAVPTFVISSPLRWGLRSPVGRHGDKGFRDWGYAPDPYFYPEDYYNVYPLLPSFIVVTTVIQQADAPPQRTLPQARSEMSEYHWPPSGSGSSATTYSIVSKDGRVQFATAVWVQGSALCYYRPDHSTGRMPVDSIDIQATRQRNAEQQLLWLPLENQTASYTSSSRHYE